MDVDVGRECNIGMVIVYVVIVRISCGECDGGNVINTRERGIIFR